jgi:glycolate oxidase FAD binding subunit
MAALGGGTKLGIGNPPSRLDLLVEMSALDSVVEYDPENLILTAQAGTTIQHVQSMVREDSVVLPLDPQSGDRATMGGVIACADHGPRRRQYGGLRDLVLGMKVVLADGSLASFGGRTLKNVAGYEVGKLFIGSLGTIGIIAEATVRLLPLPACEDLLVIILPDLETGRRLVARILDSPLLPSSLEYMSPACAGFLGLDEYLRSSDAESLMLVALEGHPAAVERQVRDISGYCTELNSAWKVAERSWTQARTVGSRRASEIGLAPHDCWDAFAGLRRKALGDGCRVGLRCTAPLACIWDLAVAAEEHSRRHGVTISYRMSCGSGYLEVHAGGSSTSLRAFAEGLRAEAENREGAVTVLEGWSRLGREFDAWGSRRSDFGLMRAVKEKFDPQGIMNPGRYVGGL